jgi:acyl dehydratase
MVLEVDVRDLPDFVGRDLGVSSWAEVSQERIDRFAEVTGDFHWMHVDVPRATRELGAPIAHGLLILSMLPMLGNELFRVTGFKGGFSYGFDHVRFTRPVAAGRRIRLRQHVKALARRNDALLVTLACIVEIEGEDHPALVAEHVGAYYDH